jgi:hypothetical protein
MLMRAKPDSFLIAKPQHPQQTETLVEEMMHTVLERLVEIDHHIPAEDDLKLVK